MTGALDRLRGTAQRLVNTYGKTLTLRQFTGNTYDPATGTNTPSYTDHSVTGVVQAFSSRLIDGSSVQVGDLDILVPAQQLSFTPNTEDKLTLDGTDWSIINPRREYSGEQVAYYRLQVRR